MSQDPGRWSDPYPPIPPRRREPAASPWVPALALIGLVALVLGGALLLRSWMGGRNDDAKRYGVPRDITPRGDLMELEKTNIAIYKKALPSVVNVNTSAVRRDVFMRTQEVPRVAPANVSFVTRAARADLYGDALNEELLMRPGDRFVTGLVGFDDHGVDGAVNGTGATLAGMSARFRRLQTGYVRSYALSVLGGSLLVVLALLAVNLT